jgi:hypothetical protein
MNIISSIRQRLMSLPTRIPPYLDGVTGMTETKEIIQRHVYEVMNDISEVSPDEVLSIGRSDQELEGCGPSNPPSHETSADSNC